MRLGILTSHPIQYQAPWFRGLSKAVDLEVFFCHRQSAAEQGKAGFGVAFDWDVDLLSGYTHRFLTNVSRKPGVNHFFGCDTPEISEIIKGPRDNKTTRQVSGEWSVVSGPRYDAFIVTGWNLKSYWQAVRACRRAGVPVLVVTGGMFGREDALAFALRTTVITKPFTRDQLTRTVESMLAGRISKGV